MPARSQASSQRARVCSGLGLSFQLPPTAAETISFICVRTFPRSPGTKFSQGSLSAAAPAEAGALTVVLKRCFKTVFLIACAEMSPLASPDVTPKVAEMSPLAALDVTPRESVDFSPVETVEVAEIGSMTLRL